MKVLFTVLLVLVAFYVQFSSQTCAPETNLARTNSTINLFDCCEENATFVLSKGPPNTVDWTLEGDRYKVLGSEECLPGEGWVYSGAEQNWICNTDVTYTGDRLSQLLSVCNGTNNLPVYNGTAWVCGKDFDYLLSLNCTSGQTVKSYNGTFFCANDNDTLGSLILKCGSNFVPVYRNGRFDCFQFAANGTGGLLASLIPNCTNLYIPKYIGGVWQCAPDNDLLRTLTCPTGQILKRTDNNTWGCGQDRDTFVNQLTANCSALGAPYDTPIFTADGWTCVVAPALNVSRNTGTFLYTNAYRFDEAGNPTDFFIGYFPFKVPYNGTIRAFAVRAIPLLGVPTLTAYVTLDGVQATSAITHTYSLANADTGYAENVGVTNLAVPVSSSQVVDMFINSEGAFTYVSVELYITLNTGVL